MKRKRLDARLEELEEKRRAKEAENEAENVIYTTVWGHEDDGTPPGKYVAEWSEDGEPKKIVHKTKWPKPEKAKLRHDDDEAPEQ